MDWSINPPLGVMLGAGEDAEEGVEAGAAVDAVSGFAPHLLKTQH